MVAASAKDALAESGCGASSFTAILVGDARSPEFRRSAVSLGVDGGPASLLLPKYDIFPLASFRWYRKLPSVRALACVFIWAEDTVASGRVSLGVAVPSSTCQPAAGALVEGDPSVSVYKYLLSGGANSSSILIERGEEAVGASMFIGGVARLELGLARLILAWFAATIGPVLARRSASELSGSFKIIIVMSDCLR
jgi:hypothetical protein